MRRDELADAPRQTRTEAQEHRRMTGKIAFQGEPGAYSHQACREARPDHEALPCDTFEDVIAAVRDGAAELAMLPVENSTYGRVADIHRLLPESGLHILDEAFLRVRISLLGLPGTTLDRDHATCARTSCCCRNRRNFLRAHGINGHAAADSAGAAAELAADRTPGEGVLASALAAEIYGLDVLARDIEDHGHNTTRFVIMGRELDLTRRGNDGMMTTFVFEVRNIPAALYKAMGGFATNGVNMTKLESYMIDGSFTATRFYADIEGHPDDPAGAARARRARLFHQQSRHPRRLPGRSAAARRTDLEHQLASAFARGLDLGGKFADPPAEPFQHVLPGELQRLDHQPRRDRARTGVEREVHPGPAARHRHQVDLDLHVDRG